MHIYQNCMVNMGDNDNNILSQCITTYMYMHKVQCNLDYPDLIYPEPQLSGLARDLKIHYHASTEGVIDDLWWVWL